MMVDPNGPAAVVRARELTRRFGRRWALRGIDLDIEPGASVALVGPNGAGKTTLLKVLATLLRPSSGEVSVLGLRLPDQSDAIRRRASMSPATGFLYDDLTALENLRFAARMTGAPSGDDGLVAELRRVGLDDAAELRLRAFSTGMRKRLELARLFLRPTELVLLDEPFASLDASAIELLASRLREARAAGTTIVFATHNPAGVAALADRVAEMADGRIVRIGPPRPAP